MAILAAVLAGAIGAVPTATGELINLAGVEWRTADRAEPSFGDASAGWRDDVWWGVNQRDSAIWLRAEFEAAPVGGDAQAASLRLSGVFSAAAYLNGSLIGRKGAPGLTAADETVGPIDSMIPMASALRSGRNELLILMSSHHTGYQPQALVHEFGIAPNGGDPRRSVSRYWVAVSLASLFVAALAVFTALRPAPERRSARAWASAAAICLLIALAAETSRTWWNYPYSLHVVRMSTVFGALVGFGFATLMAAMTFFRIGRMREIALAALAAVGVAALLQKGFDARATAGLSVLFAFVAAATVRRALNGDVRARAVVGVAVVLAGYAWLWPNPFMDNGVYVFGGLTLILAAFGLIERAPARDAGARRAADDETRVLQVDVGDDRVDVPYDEIVLVKAAGNYAEVRLQDGATLLTRASLSAIDAATAPPLMRVHKSFIVNLAYARRLVAKSGSRYALELGAQGRAPVSRRQAGDVRDALKALEAP